jgi:hypothetical protein
LWQRKVLVRKHPPFCGRLFARLEISFALEFQHSNCGRNLGAIVCGILAHTASLECHLARDGKKAARL